MAETVFVTGAGGFVGFATTKALLKAGHNVRAFELTGSPHLADLNKLAQTESKLTVIEGNITRKADIENAIGNANYVIHSAALLNSIAPYETFYNINVRGADNAMEVASAKGVKRFLLVSTSDVFGIPQAGETITESTPYRPWREPYADTKIQACEHLKSYGQQNKLEYTIIYPGWVYGPGDKQFFPAIIDMLKDKHVFLWDKGTPYQVDFIYIDDLVNGILKALFSPNAINEDFLILNDQATMTPADIFQWMANHLGLEIKLHKIPYPIMMAIAKSSQWLCQKGLLKKHLLSTTDVKAFGNSFSFSADKARKVLDWDVTIQEEEGFINFFAWHKHCQIGQ